MLNKYEHEIISKYGWEGVEILTNHYIRSFMSGTIKGGYKAAKTNIKKYGKDYYANIGRKGGKKSRTGGFASNKVGRDGLTGAERAKIAGAKGGHKSKRKPVTIEEITKRTQAAGKLAQVLADYTPTEVK